ncbi:MAG: hypothetical protein IT562_11130 [Alphaproteobacteria bacterium]|nr:hypothetical protein [Alphaproteobacteria bacterium]
MLYRFQVQGLQDWLIEFECGDPGQVMARARKAASWRGVDINVYGPDGFLGRVKAGQSQAPTAPEGRRGRRLSPPSAAQGRETTGAGLRQLSIELQRAMLDLRRRQAAFRSDLQPLEAQRSNSDVVADMRASWELLRERFGLADR